MILCAAVKFHIDKTDADVVIPCWRHYCAYDILKDLGFGPKEGYTKIADGFLNHRGEFMTREEAYHHGCECGQLSDTVKRNVTRDELFSEDLY